MGVMDKFLNAMRLNSDDDEDFYDDEFYDEEEDDFGEPPKKSRFKNSRKSKDHDDYDDFDEVPITPMQSSKVTPMRAPSKRGTSSAPTPRNTMSVCVIKPISVEDAKEIIETLLSGRTIVLNLEGLDLEIAQRIIDYTSGASYAIGGNLQKISNYIFIVTPKTVDITGDIQNIMGSFGAEAGLGLGSDI